MWQKLKFPILCLLGFGALILFWKLFKLPPESELIEIIRGYFLQYGLVTVFVAALIEAMLLAGVYLPGGLVIFLGVLFSAGNPKHAALSVLMTILGFSLGYLLNYSLGKYGWYKVLVKFGLSSSLETAKEQFEKHGYKAIWLSYWQPNLAAFTSTAAGILGTSFVKFVVVSCAAAFTWSAFWGILAYFVGDKVLMYLGPLFLIIMIGWIATIIWQHYRFEKK